MKLNGLLVAILTVSAVACVIGPVAAEAQQSRPARDGATNRPTTQSGSSRGGRGNNVQQLQLNRIRELLGSSDEEWKILEPRILKIQDLLRDSGARGGITSGRGRRGGFGGAPDPDTVPTPVQLAAKELQESLASKEASAEDIKSKLAALRDARVKSQTDLTKAQDQLREVLTARQEAALVMAGLLN